jgi:succinate dehydrogenase / fumarate reductase membrane anchor subunit
MTDRKRAVGLGAAKSGTEHHWRMTVSSYALVILTPLFVFTFGPILGAPYTEVASYFARPFPAIVAGLMIVVGMLHFKNGVQVLIEDYVHGMARHWLIIAMVCLSYAVIATAILALARLAL